MNFETGQPVPRTEDPRLRIGAGKYTDDFNYPHQTQMIVIRSPHAPAIIRNIVFTRSNGLSKRKHCQSGRLLGLHAGCDQRPPGGRAGGVKPKGGGPATVRGRGGGARTRSVNPRTVSTPS